MEHKFPNFEDLCQQNYVNYLPMFCDYSEDGENGMEWSKFV